MSALTALTLGPERDSTEAIGNDKKWGGGGLDGVRWLRRRLLSWSGICVSVYGSSSGGVAMTRDATNKNFESPEITQKSL